MAALIHGVTICTPALMPRSLGSIHQSQNIYINGDGAGDIAEDKTWHRLPKTDHFTTCHSLANIEYPLSFKIIRACFYRRRFIASSHWSYRNIQPHCHRRHIVIRSNFPVPAIELCLRILLILHIIASCHHHQHSWSWSLFRHYYDWNYSNFTTLQQLFFFTGKPITQS